MQIFSNLKTGTKLTCAFLAVAAIILIVAALGHFSLKALNGNMVTLYNDRMVCVEQLGNAQSAMLRMRGDTYKYFLLPEQRGELKRNIAADVEIVNKNIKDYKATYLVQAEKDEIPKFDSAWAGYQQAVADIVKLINAGDEKTALQSERDGAAHISRTAIDASIENLIQIQVDVGGQIKKDSDRIFTLTNVIMTVAGIIGVLFAIMLGMFIGRSIARPLERVTKVARSISEGDLDAGELAGITPRRDEIGILAGAFTLMTSQLKETLEGLRRLNRELRASEEKYRVVADFTYDWETWIGLDHQFIYISPSCQRITGYTADEFINDFSLYGRIVHPDDREIFEKHLEEIHVESTPDCRVEFRIITRNGEERWIEHLCGNIFGTDGKWLGQRSNNRDITDRKRMEEALHRLNRELRAISNCNQTLLRAEEEQTLLNDICRIVCDEAGYRLAWVGYAEHDDAKTVRPVAWAGIESGYLKEAKITWADTERGRGPTGIAIRTGETDCIRDFATEPKAAPWRDRALQQGYRSSIALPLKDESKKTFGTLTIYSTELNAFTPDEIWLLEELSGDLAFGITVLRGRIERNRAEEALRESEEKYRLIFEYSPLGLLSFDEKGAIVACNDNFVQIIGSSREKLIGLNMLNLPDKNIVSTVQQALNGSQGSYEGIYSSVTAKKNTPVRCLFTPMNVGGGGITGGVGIIEDITERKRAEGELERYRDNLEKLVKERTADLARSNAELEQFAYVASHDLQEPLRMVVSYLQLVDGRYREKLDADAREFIGFAVDGAKRMQALINDLLAYSRIGTQGQAFQPTDCEAVLQMAMRNLEVAIRESGAQIAHDPLPTVMGDATQLVQLFQNLIGNALKFRRDEPPQIHIRAELKAGFWCLSVQDNGIGIESQYFERIFVVFQRLHGRGSYPGTGIGLAICKKIVERHGGTIWVESELGKGSTFRFTIPGKHSLEQSSGMRRTGC